MLHVSSIKERAAAESMYKYSDTLVNQKISRNPIHQLEAELKKVKSLSSNSKHNYVTVHEYSNFIEAIRNFVTEKEIDLIIMGTRGESEMNDVVIGSHTADVITKVKCSVLVIPENAKYTSPKNIVFPTDFNIFYKNKVLNLLSEIFESKKAILSVLFVSKSLRDLSSLQKKNRSYLEDYLIDKPHGFHFITNENIDDAIETFVSTEKIDMIAMVAKNLNFFQRILFHPTVEKISYHTKVPFLVLHD